MKGITPIISIIILLMITVGLAAAAWSYMLTYMESLTAKSIEISMQKCADGDALAVVHNMGTAKITIASDVVIWDKDGDLVSGGIDWEDLQGTDITEIDAGKYGKVTIACCTGAACPKTCTFDIVVAGRSRPITVFCP